MPDVFEQQYEQLNRQLGIREKKRKREAATGMASRGMGRSGLLAKREGQIGGDIDEAYRAGAMAIEQQREAARQAGLGREHEVGMQERQLGSAAEMQQAGFGHEQFMSGLTHEQQLQYQQIENQAKEKYLKMGFTNEQALQAAQLDAQKQMQQAGFGQERWMGEAQHGWKLGEMEAGAGYESQLQEQLHNQQLELDQEKAQLTDWLEGQGWDRSEATRIANQQFAGEESALAREQQRYLLAEEIGFKEWSQMSAEEQELEMQRRGFGQEKAMFEKGTEHEQYMAEMQNDFMEKMERLGYSWHVADQAWQAKMWEAGAQLQMELGGFGPETYDFTKGWNPANWQGAYGGFNPSQPGAWSGGGGSTGVPGGGYGGGGYDYNYGDYRGGGW